MCAAPARGTGFHQNVSTQEAIDTNKKPNKKYCTKKKLVEHTRHKHSRRHKNKLQGISMFTASAAGLKLKVHSLRQELKHVEAGMFTIQESHFKKKGHNFY